MLAEHEGLRLTRTGPTGLRAAAAPGTVEAVLDALLDNAVKFGPAGTGIVLHTAAGSGEVCFGVRDHGPGLAPDELDRATDRFWRSPAHHNLDGTGLGLAIADGLLRGCGGDLALDLPGGGGLRVTARLPAAGPVTGELSRL